MKSILFLFILSFSLASYDAAAQKPPTVTIKREIKKHTGTGEFEVTTVINVSFLYDLSAYEDILPKNDSLQVKVTDPGEGKFKSPTPNSIRFSFTSTGSNLVLKQTYTVSGIHELLKNFKGTFKYIFHGGYYTVDVKPEDVTYEEVE